MEPHKRYIVFQFSEYYPSGGLGDSPGSYDTIEEAVKKIKEIMFDCNEVYDRVEGISINLEQYGIIS